MATPSAHAPSAQTSTLVDLLRLRARTRPDDAAFTFLEGGVTEGARLTYGELDRRARAIAATLRTVAQPGDRALLHFPPGLDFVAAFFGCLYAGVMAMPVQPSRRGRASRRVQAVAADAEPVVVLGTGTFAMGAAAASIDKAIVVPAFTLAPDPLTGVSYIATDRIDLDAADRWHPPDLSAETIALLQYTSGSTSAPRGVMVSHENLLHNSESIRCAFQLSERSVSVSWLPHFHDMGLIDGILQPLYSGFPAYLMAPGAFVQSPLRWLRAISAYRATHSGGPDFAYALCVSKSLPEQRVGLDLSGWTSAYDGAEPIHAETLDAFRAAFAPHGFRSTCFYPCYGLAEATLMVSGGSLDAEPVCYPARADALEQHTVVRATSAGEKTRLLVGCGHARPGTRIAIVGADARLCAPGRVGEIWVAGPGVAQGYWGRADLTREIFGARLHGEDDGPFLRTGDVGFVDDDGELFVTGRLKDLIIVHGRNHYPHDLELTAARAHAATSAGTSAAFLIRTDDVDRVVMVSEIGRRAPASYGIEAIASAIRDEVFGEHELRLDVVVLVEARTIPKTSSGKVERHTVRREFLSGGLREIGRSVLPRDDEAFVAEPLSREKLLALDGEAQRGRLARYVVQCVRETLRIPASWMDEHQSLASLGIDSLQATELAHRFERELGVVIPVPDLLQDERIERVAERLQAALLAVGVGVGVGDAATLVVQPPAIAADTVASDDARQLSSGQRALWFVHQLAPRSGACNIGMAFRASPPLRREMWEELLNALVERHHALRTVVHLVNGEPVPRVLATHRIELGEGDLAELSEAAIAARIEDAAHEPFDLASALLFRARLFSCGRHAQIVLLCAHHMMLDLWSATVVLDDLRLLRERQVARDETPLPPPARQSADHASWQAQLVASQEGDRQWHYWRQQMADAPALSELPLDWPRATSLRFRGGVERCHWDAERAARVTTHARAHGTSPYVLLLAAFRLLVHRYTGQRDFVIGLSTAGRSRAAFAGTVGYLANQLPLRVQVAGNPTFVELLASVTHAVRDALAHGDLPYPLLVQRLAPARDRQAVPLFQTMFVLAKAHRAQLSAFVSGASGPPLALAGTTLEPVPLSTRTARFDLTATLIEHADGLTISWEYDSDLFDPATVRRLNTHLGTLIDAVTADGADASLPISQLPMLSAGERHTMLVDWNRTHAPAAAVAEPAHRAFERQAARVPEAVAVQFPDGRLTYRELNMRANQLARRLRRLGVGPDDVVGLAMRRSPQMIAAVLAVLKAGGAYVPLDPAYPRERLAFMATDSGAVVFVTDNDSAGVLPDGPQPRIVIDEEWRAIEDEACTNPEAVGSGRNLAYIIYTSGSTGWPKGVMIEQRALSNYLHWCIGAYRVAEGSGAPLNSSISFDATITALFPPLMTGRTVFIIQEGHEIAGLRHLLLSQADLSLVKITPAHLHLLRSLFETERIRVPRLGTRAFIVGGEALSAELARFWRLTAPGTRLVNEYGPTETVVGACVYEVDDDRQTMARTIPIGRPIANTEMFVLDDQQQPVPVGVIGELYIGGAGCARGYRGRRDLTASRFVASPFGSTAGARVYRTGDMVRYLADGLLEFVGRRDDQVSLRGYRIEFGEIEAVLCRHEAVREAAAVVAAVTGVDGAGGADRADRANGEDGQEIGRSLVAYVVTSRPVETAEIREHAARMLPRHMVPSAIVTLDALPKSANGKIDRRALESSASHTRTAVERPATAADGDERAIAEIWCDLLRVERVGLDENFFDVGGHSMLMMPLQQRLASRLRKPVTILDLLAYPTIRGLARQLAGVGPASRVRPAGAADRAAKQRKAVIGARHAHRDAQVEGGWSTEAGMTPIVDLLADLARSGVVLWMDDDRLRYRAPPEGLTPAVKQLLQDRKPDIVAHLTSGRDTAAVPRLARLSDDRAVPISWNQEPLWLLERLAPRGSFSNQVSALLAVGRLDVDALRRTLDEIVRRHEALRTAFIEVDGRAMQVVRPAGACPLIVEDLRHTPEETRQQRFLRRLLDEGGRPFDLAAGVPYRAALFRMAGDQHIIVQFVHHLVWDGWSRELVNREIASIYGALTSGTDQALPMPPLQYRDFTHWQHACCAADSFAPQVAYWLEQFDSADLAPASAAPTGYERLQQLLAGTDRQLSVVPRTLADGLRDVGLRSGCTPMMGLFAVFAVCLSGLRNRTELRAATLVSTRTRRELEPMVGMFLNTLALRVDLSGDPTFLTILTRVRETVAGAFAHSEVPFEMLARAFERARRADRAGLLDTMFLYHAAAPDDATVPLAELTLTALDFKALEESKPRPSSFDLTFTARELEVGLSLCVEYKSSTVKPGLARELLDRLPTVIEAVIGAPDIRLSRLVG